MTEVDIPSGLAARIPTPLPGDPRLGRLSLNQRTTAGWSLRQALDGAVRAGLPAVGLWREPVAEAGLDDATRLVRESGVRVSSLCRGGFFTDPASFDTALADNRRAIDEAAALGAPTLVLVAGGLAPGDRDLVTARDRVISALDALVDTARAHGVQLAIEPMHPIFAADRGVISTLAQALDIAERFPAEEVGVVVDTFHVWWEPGVVDQIARAGDRIASFQVNDWITPLPADTLLSRGMMGDGHIDFASMTTAVAEAGYRGDVEVEIFNAEIWSADPDEVVATMKRRYVELIEPFLVGARAVPAG